MALRLRLRGPDGKQHTASLPESATFGALLFEASSAFSIPTGEMECLLGFPPALCSATLDTPLAGLVKSGDSVTVRQSISGPVTQASSSEAFAPAAPAAPAVSPAAQPAAAGLSSGSSSAPLGGPAASGPPAISSIRTSEPWSCPACTLENPGGKQTCEACDGPRPGTSSTARPGSGEAASDGFAKLVPMPDDNSCLFHGVAHLLDPSKPPGSLRQIVAQEVRANPVQWDEATLGKPPSEYINFISDPIRWGGQVELAIFASAYRSEIAVVEVQSGRCDVYGEGCGYGRRVYLLYSGIHFDAVTFGPSARSEVSAEACGEADAAVQQLVAERRSAGAFVDQKTMRLRCKVCGYIAEGDYEARAHAGETGHKEFAPA
eukprot:CAMPEP_0115111412 /NCGR_PEP_ID=MMETSP0227-20121206/40013_1 /TAXON_ID=89957 /ORGANISM="Polarella glacialis, Strain CCMP 1383" /LENGTH=375 /DNA_ID=CAMNT_0002510751 /DNA_START=95 /DNA_END=1222 /DNA_ORIENTATION=+